MKIFRQELFGGVCYDDVSLGYKMISGSPDMSAAFERVIPLSHIPERTDILSGPVRIYFELTRRCNLSCAHCFAGSSSREPEGLDIGSIRALLEDLKNAGVINIRFTGGEPTVREDWHEIVTYARSLGLVVSLSTNGILTDRTIEKIASVRPEQVTLSLDGLEESHDRIRGKGTFTRVLSSLEKLRRSGLNLRLTTVLNRLNSKEIPGIVEIAAPYVGVMNFVCMRPIGRALANPEMLLDFESHSESARCLSELNNRFPHLLLLHSALPLPDLFVTAGAQAGLSSEKACSFSDTALFVDADGQFWPHHYLSYQSDAFRLGRSQSNPVLDVWAHSPILDRFRQWTRALKARCASCPELNVRCQGANFELEVAACTGQIPENPYCINEASVPSVWEFIERTASDSGH